MKENALIDLSRQFAIDIINLCGTIGETRKWTVLVNQLLRSGTSVGANIHEANYGSSKPDFINKMQIALKECFESEYWLGIMKETQIISDVQYEDLYRKCSKIRAVLIATLKTAKNRNIK